MEKPNNSSREEEYHFCELPNFELKFYAGPPPREFARFSEQELNQLVAHRHSALGDGPENNKLVCISLSRVNSNAYVAEIFGENFLAILRQQNSAQAITVKPLRHRKPFKVAYYSFEGVNESNFKLVSKMFRSIFSFSFRYLLQRPTIICDI